VAVAIAGGGPATVTPVFTASEAGMEERPGVIETLAVNTGASTAPPAPEPQSQEGRPVGGGPHQHPGGAFCHWVTYAVTVLPMQGDTAVTVV
jgi:hypothetical protein